MNPSSGNPGLSKLASILQGQMQKNQEANSALVLDFGEIQADYSLLTNTYPIPIPKTDYLVCRCVSYKPVQALPENMYWVRPGDRVLVAWVQNDAIVVDKILPASQVGG